MRMNVLRMTWCDTQTSRSGEFSAEILGKDIEGYVVSLRILFDTKDKDLKFSDNQKHKFTAFINKFVVSVNLGPSEAGNFITPTSMDPEPMVHYWDMLHAWKNKL